MAFWNIYPLIKCEEYLKYGQCRQNVHSLTNGCEGCAFCVFRVQ